MTSAIQIVTVFGMLMLLCVDDLDFSQAVHLAKIGTGNTTLDNALPDLYERVDESIYGYMP
jgi:hypothetical protein